MRLFSLLVLLFFFNIVQAQDNLFKHFKSQLSLELDENFTDNKNLWVEYQTPGKFAAIGKGYYNIIGSPNSKIVSLIDLKIDIKADFMISLAFEIKAQSGSSLFGLTLGKENRYNFTFGKLEGARLATYVNNNKFGKEKLSSNIGSNIKLDLIKSGAKINIFIDGKFIKAENVLNDLSSTIGFFLEDAGAVKIDYLKIYSDTNSYLKEESFTTKKTDNFKSLISDNFDSDETTWQLSQMSHFKSEINKGRYIIISSSGIEKSIINKVDIDKNDDYVIETRLKKKGADSFGKYGINWNIFNNEVFQGIQVMNGNKIYYLDQTINSKTKELLATIPTKSSTKIKAVKVSDSLYIFINDIYTRAFKTSPFIANQVGFYTEFTGALSIDYIKVYSGDFSKLTPDELKIQPKPVVVAEEAPVVTEALQTNIVEQTSSLTPYNYGNTSIIEQVQNINQGGFAFSLPPILKIEHISFSKNTISAGEKATLKLGVKNIGPGDANDVYLDIRSNIAELSFLSDTNFPTIKAKGGTQELSIEIEAGMNLTNQNAILKINIIEPHFKLKIQGKQIKFQTKEFQKPKLILAKFATIENQAANPNNEINLNEIIDVKLAIQNIGHGMAQNIKLKVENNQKGVMLLGVMNNDELRRENPLIDSIGSGKYETVIYRFFVNSEFIGEQLKFNITSAERYGRYGFYEEKTVRINTQLKEEGFIRSLDNNTPLADNNEVIIEDILDFVVDVDNNIPNINMTFDNRYAVVVGNEDYKSKQTDLKFEQNVEFAVNDAKIFAQYCEKVLGIPKRQIKLLINATSAEMKQASAWLANLTSIENGNAEIYYYYSGHGLPHEQTKESYLIPVDVSGNNIEFGIKLQDLYQQLSQSPSKQITLFLDACFSGGGRNQGLLAMKGVKVKPKEHFLLSNMLVFTSSTGDESSSVYREKEHGYFTYFLLKKLQESEGKVSYSNLGNYINSQVRKETGIKGLIQTPQINVSSQLESSWNSLMLNPLQ